MSWMAIICVASGGAFLLEGLGWAIMPAAMRDAYRKILAEASDRHLHLVGLFAVAFGVLLLGLGIKAS